MGKWKVTLEDGTIETVEASSIHRDTVKYGHESRRRIIFYKKQGWGKQQYIEPEFTKCERIEE